MNELFVLVEHRRGEIRDITFEMLSLGRHLAQKNGISLTAVLLADHTDEFTGRLKNYADTILCIDEEKAKNFNSAVYQKILSSLLRRKKPLLTLIGHTAFGLDLAPSLSAEVGLPLATDCIGLDLENRILSAERQMFGGKVNARIILNGEPGYIATIQPGAFQPEENQSDAKIEKIAFSLNGDTSYRRFMEYVEAAIGDVDITQSDIVIAVGRGIKEQENLSMVEDLASSAGGVLACSRPIVDAGWLPKARQVGSSGKTVNPKLYIAIGISGSSQHLTGMKGAKTIVAINKDPNAPIFNVADYGIVDDLLKVVPVLKEKILEVKNAVTA
jgi:electron transfer flavoprotein alpha subunit